MRRLYLQFYLTALGIILLFALLCGAAWILHSPATEDEGQLTEGIGIVLGDLLPAPGQPLQLQAAIERYSDLFPVQVAVYDDDGETLLASHGEAPHRPLVLPPRMGASFTAEDQDLPSPSRFPTAAGSSPGTPPPPCIECWGDC